MCNCYTESVSLLTAGIHSSNPTEKLFFLPKGLEVPSAAQQPGGGGEGEKPTPPTPSWRLPTEAGRQPSEGPGHRRPEGELRTNAGAETESQTVGK